VLFFSLAQLVEKVSVKERPSGGVRLLSIVNARHIALRHVIEFVSFVFLHGVRAAELLGGDWL